MSVIDWSLSDKFAEDIIYCKCGEIYRSHSKLLPLGNRLIIYTRKSCPKCGKDYDHVKRVTSEKELWTI